MSNHGEWKDWVGELFEPAFGATIEDLVAGEDEPKNKPRVKHMSVHDPEAIRKVYERVHMMAILDEEMRAQKKEPPGAQKQQQQLQQQKQQRPIEVKAPESGTLASIASPSVAEESSCIWDSAEIGVLRQAYRKLKEDSIESMVHVRETMKRNEDLEKHVVEQKHIIASQKVKLSEAKIANKRLKIHVDSLTEEVKYLTAKTGAMEEVIREVKTEHSDMVKEMHENRVTTDKERMERERIKLKLDLLKREALAEKLAAEDKIRTQCRKAIHDLKEEVKKLEKELMEEKEKRLVTEKGLKHLRNHFSSLSVQDIMPHNAVDRDQIGFIQY
ncbi:probable inactive protein kinase DDB_G0270444 [Dreissena polymorpha]|nr:probable inactive protein kinase DDB_G0270444 [Dreissena polymorpha]XP_052217808.1 probable inactive protein kinase DDB_G0270444 [Dreissena polymorpha]